MAILRAVIVGIILWLLITPTAHAQTTAPRIRSDNGAWLLPVAGNVLCSDEHRHIGRGSVRAWDLCVPYGSAIYPLANGRVIYAGCNNAGGYGCWVMTDYGNGCTSIMGHMIAGSLTVRTGETVSQQQQIGRVGWTGQTSFGPHVHMEISCAGNRVMIGNYFSRSMLKDCPLCNTPGDPVSAVGTVGIGNPLLTSQSPLWAIVTIAGYLLLWFAYEHKRVWVATLHNAFALVAIGHLPMIAAILIALLPGQAMGPALGSMESDQQWAFAYGFVRRWEGTKCTHDPVRTFKGITQGTYNRYRMELGIGPADVCAALTERQAAAIYYRYYYLRSGANRLPPAIALQVFDMYVNAGVNLYPRCGNDFDCYSRARIAYYQSAAGCPLYCGGWLNRVADLERYVKGAGHADQS